MPLEVTPAPFASSQRLPYTPAFARTDLPGGLNGSAGPPSGSSDMASGGASAMIPPAPGGVADPHRAIPALPEAGYTAPSFQAPSVSDPRYAGGESVYGGASVYGGPGAGVGQRGPPSSVLGGERPVQPHVLAKANHVQSPLSVVHSEGWSSSSMPSPRRGPDSGIAPRSEAHPHHLPRQYHHPHGDSDDRDDSSDASYYAVPNQRKLRPRSNSVSSASDVLGPANGAPRRPHHRHHHRSRSFSSRYRSPPGHSPLSAQPVNLAPGPAAGTRHEAHAAPTKQRTFPSPPRDSPPTPQRHAPEDRGYKTQSSITQSHVADGPVPQDKDRRRERRHSTLTHDMEHLHVSAPRYPPPPKEVNHRRHRSNSYLPPATAAGYASDRSATSHHRHSPASTLGHGGEIPEMPQYDTTSARGHRRAHSMHGGNDWPYAYRPPSAVGAGPGSVYDDGASAVSDSRMTFMDGSVAGRTSQYGLPKYPHQPKVDYRRFCVQRGNADVYLD
ncbi:hypothetical protein IAU60_002998 [Kwoniella sp. DSM 27419]